MNQATPTPPNTNQAGMQIYKAPFFLKMPFFPLHSTNVLEIEGTSGETG